MALYLGNLRALLVKRTLPIAQEGVIYHCTLNGQKIINFVFQRVNKMLFPYKEIALPHILHVGVTTACNLRCPACPTGTKALGRKTQHLDYELYKGVVDELKGSLMFMLFWDWGEPFLHPKLTDMIAHARDHKIKTVISTNGTVPKSQADIDALVLAQPSLVIVCVDGATQESYETYRVGGMLNDVLNTIAQLRLAKKKLNSQYPVIEFRSLATRYTESQMPRLLEMADEMGSDIFSVKTLRPYDYRGHDVDDELTPLEPELARYVYDDNDGENRVRVPDPIGALKCGKPLYAPTLNSNGEMVFCSYSRGEEMNFGKMAAGSVKQRWKAKSAVQKRHDFLRLGGNEACSSCYFRSDHKPTIIHTVTLRPLPDDISLVNSKTKNEFLAEIAA